jgi:hypothetical protein
VVLEAAGIPADSAGVVTADAVVKSFTDRPTGGGGGGISRPRDLHVLTRAQAGDRILTRTIFGPSPSDATGRSLPP